VMEAERLREDVACPSTVRGWTVASEVAGRILANGIKSTLAEGSMMQQKHNELRASDVLHR